MQVQKYKPTGRPSKTILGVIVFASIVAIVSGGFAVQQYNRSNQPVVSVDDSASTGSIDINAALVAATDKPTFKLFAPAWRGLGGNANKENVKNFPEIFTNMPPANVKSIAPDSKVYNYTLGPYVTARYVPCDLIPSEIPADIKNNCGKADSVLSPDAIGRQVGNPSKATYARGFKNNFALVPDNEKTLALVKKEAAEELVRHGSGDKAYDGIFSDSMGVAPLGEGYLVSPILKPGTSGTYSASEWLAAQTKMLEAKKEGLSDGKVLIMNGLANGDSYFKEVSAKQLLTGANLYGGMAERIFREPNETATNWSHDIGSWKNDVNMIRDVQENVKIRGYWWSKCWSDGGSLHRDTCLDDAGGEAALKQVRRFVVASYLLGAGDKSYFNFDTDICDGGYVTVNGQQTCPGGNAAEWTAHANDYKKAMDLGSASGSYAEIGSSKVFSRSFAKGIVLVNPSNESARINLGSTVYTDFDSNEAKGSNYPVAAHTGVVLLKKDAGGGTSDDDTTKPTISISVPTNNATVEGSVDVKGTANDNKAVAKVDVRVDGEVVATDTDEPWFTTKWDSTTVANGNHKLSVTATDAAGNSATSDEIVIRVNNPAGAPGEPRILSLNAEPSKVKVGEKTTLKWTTQFTASCSITPDGLTNTKETSWETPALRPAGTKKFTLQCINATGKKVEQSVSVTVENDGEGPSKPTLSANATSVKKGSNVTLSWSSDNASSCVLKPGDYTAKGERGTRVVMNLTVNTTFTVTCKNSSGEKTSDPLTVKVETDVIRPDFDIIFFKSDQQQVRSGERATLSWLVKGARMNGCAVQPSLLSSVGASESWITPKLTATITYRLTCVAPNGKVATKTTTIRVGDEVAAPEPRPRSPTTLATVANRQVTDTATKTSVSNAAVTSQVSGRVSFDPSNIIDNERSSNIAYVAYYDDDGNEVEKVTTRPFAFDSTKRANARYAMTERTVFKDGSQSEVARIIDVDNEKVVNWWSNPWVWLLVSLPIAIAAGIVYIVRSRDMTTRAN